MISINGNSNNYRRNKDAEDNANDENTKEKKITMLKVIKIDNDNGKQK